MTPDRTEVRRKGTTNILICQPVTSDWGTVHYRWGYTNLATEQETMYEWDYNYYMYSIGIDTLRYLYWVETYFEEPEDQGCANRSYYANGLITSIKDYANHQVDAHITDNQLVISIQCTSANEVSATLYDATGKMLLFKDFGRTNGVSDAIPVRLSTGIYLLKVNIGNQLYSVKLLKL